MQLSPIHRSAMRVCSLTPLGMSQAALPHGAREVIEREVLDIFTSMVNAGCSLQSTLTAIYLSGMSAGKELSND